MRLFRSFRALAVCVLALALASVSPLADMAPQLLPFTQDWSDTALLTVDDDWSGAPGIVGYRGDGMTGSTGINPQTIVAPGGLVTDVNANQTTPNTFTTGGVAEFHLTDPVVALQGSGTARAPHIVLSVNTSALANITVDYVLRDIDGSADNAVQAVALQYRVGNSGNYTNVAAGFVADATQGPSIAGLATAVHVVLPADAAGKPLVQIRIITTDAAGADEWVGIDNISVTGAEVPTPTNPTGIAQASPSNVAPGASTLLTVGVTPGTNPASTGLAVTADLTPIGGAAAQPLFDNGTNGDVTANDKTFSYLATVAAATPTGNKTLNVTISDAEARSSAAAAPLTVFVPITSVTISQVYGGGGNSGATYKNDFVELYNRSAAPVDVTGWSVQYASANGATWGTPTVLSGVIQPGTYYLVQQAAGTGGTTALPAPDATGGYAMSGSAGKVALVAASGAMTVSCPVGPTIVDFVGYGNANCFEGSGAAPELSNTTAAIRQNGGATDTGDNAADFLEATASPKNSTGQPPTGIGSATPASLDSGDTSLLTVKVTPGAFPASVGLGVTSDLTAIGGSAAQPFYDDASHGDVSAGDGTFSFSSVVTGTQGVKVIVATVSDQSPGRSTLTNFSVTIQAPPIAIHQVQGSASRSIYEGQLITTTGIVTARRPGSYYIQTPEGQEDADPNTSEGLLVFSAPGTLAVGDLVKVSGRVVEFVPNADPQSPPITELSSAAATILSRGNTLPAPAVLLSSFTSATGNFEQLERFEGMRVRADVTAITGTAAFRRNEAEEAAGTSTSNGDFFTVLTGVQRPLREAGLDPTQETPVGPCCIPRFDGNPERMRVDSDGQIGAQKIEIVAGQTIAGLTGVLDYGFRSYTIVPDPQPWTPAGRGEAEAVPAALPNEFTVASFNVERFFDSEDDPLKDEAVLTPAAFEMRLNKASLSIRTILGLPDILGVIEIENLSSLQALANRINGDEVAGGRPSPEYSAHLLEGNDPGGIDVGFLVKRSRVDVFSLEQVGADARYLPPGATNTAILNDRPSLVLEAAIRADGAIPYPVTVIVNHLRSLSGIDGDDAERIRFKRRAQAEFLANYIQGRQAANPSERIISVGDYNAFQFNDGYADLIGTIIGAPTPATEVQLASPDLVNPNLTNLGNALGAQQYSFLFDGNAQTLDHVLVNDAALRRVVRMVYGRVNADFPESLRGRADRAEKLSDHDPAVAYFALPNAPIVTLNGAASVTVEAGAAFVDPGATASDEELGTLPVTVSGTVNTAVVGTYTVTYSASNGFLSATQARTVSVVDTTRPELTLLGHATMTIELGATWTDPGATASDIAAGNLTSAIVVTGAVNTSVVGTYTLTYEVSDGYNSATATRTVQVVDTTAPTLSAVSATPSVIAVPNHKMIDVVLGYTTSDLGGAPSCSVSVTSNEHANATGDGNTEVDWQVLSLTHVRVRAERAGMGSGRVYTIVVTCTDASGNSASQQTTVAVR
jgi:uncharacterized protein